MAVPRSAPRLEEDGVLLRAHRPDDATAVHRQSLDPDAQRWTQVPVPYRREDADAWLAGRAREWSTGRTWTWAVEVEGRYAGTVDLRPDGAGQVEVGYSLAAWARGRGAMSQALRTALTWAFADAEQTVALWWAHVGNWPSRRVAWAVGFTVEGVVRGAKPHRGERRDCWVGSLRAEDPLRPATAWLELPRVDAGAVVLRGNGPDDALRITQACADPCTQRWLPSLPSPYTVVDAAAYIAAGPEELASARALHWAVAEPGTDLLLAQVGLMGLAPDATRTRGVGRTAEVGYWAHPDARGRGVVTAGVRAAVRHGLLPAEDGGLGLERVVLRAAEGNAASQAVAERVGFRRVGLERGAERLRDGSRQAFLVYDLLAEELRP